MLDMKQGPYCGTKIITFHRSKFTNQHPGFGVFLAPVSLLFRLCDQNILFQLDIRGTILTSWDTFTVTPWAIKLRMDMRCVYRFVASRKLGTVSINRHCIQRRCLQSTTQKCDMQHKHIKAAQTIIVTDIRNNKPLISRTKRHSYLTTTFHQDTAVQ